MDFQILVNEQNLSKKNDTTTRGIKHWGLGGYQIFLLRIKLVVTHHESSPQSPTISYRHPLPARLNKETELTN